MLTSHTRGNERKERSKDPAYNEGHVEFMKTLPLKWIEKNEQGERTFELEISTDRGVRTVDYYFATGLWKVRDGKGEGYGIPRMARYFNIGGFPKNRDKEGFDNARFSERERNNRF